MRTYIALVKANLIAGVAGVILNPKRKALQIHMEKSVESITLLHRKSGKLIAIIQKEAGSHEAFS